MRHDDQLFLAHIAGHPVRAMFTPFPAVCFTAAFLTDIIYWRTADMQWTNFSVWLLTFGLFMGGFALLATIVDLAKSAQLRGIAAARWHLVGALLVWVLSLLNAFVHSRDAYTSVVPDGLILSTVVVVLLTVTGWVGDDLVYRRRMGVTG